ncbi:hypothetical protein [Actinomadura fulvescens]
MTALRTGALAPSLLAHACALVLDAFPDATTLGVSLPRFYTKGYPDVAVHTVRDSDGRRLYDYDREIGYLAEYLSPTGKDWAGTLDEIVHLLNQHTLLLNSIDWPRDDRDDPEYRTIALKAMVDALIPELPAPSTPRPGKQHARDCMCPQPPRSMPNEC